MDITAIIANRPADEIISCDGQLTVREAVALLSEKRIGALPVKEGEDVVGIFSERDVVTRIAGEGDRCLEMSVSEVMTAPPVTVTADTPVLQALTLMTRRRFRHLPVVESDAEGAKMIGFVSIGDLVKARIDQLGSEAEAMRAYIQTV